MRETLKSWCHWICTLRTWKVPEDQFDRISMIISIIIITVILIINNGNKNNVKKCSYLCA
jgi:hypothetical protein